MEVDGGFSSVIVWGGQSSCLEWQLAFCVSVYCSLSQAVISIHLLKKHEAQLWLHFKYCSFQPFNFFTGSSLIFHCNWMHSTGDSTAEKQSESSRLCRPPTTRSPVRSSFSCAKKPEDRRHTQLPHVRSALAQSGSQFLSSSAKFS